MKKFPIQRNFNLFVFTNKLKTSLITLFLISTVIQIQAYTEINKKSKTSFEEHNLFTHKKNSKEIVFDKYVSVQSLVTGKVTDSNGVPLFGASVLEKALIAE
jgi:protocatechuate 3,4-dioxygenase beta subunit